MANNSNSKDGKNNNRNPTLRDHERAKGHSGAAIHGKGISGTSESKRGGGGSGHHR